MEKLVALPLLRHWAPRAPLMITTHDGTVWAGYKVATSPSSITIRAARDNGRREILFTEIRSIERHPKLPLLPAR